jgi:phosphoribosyl-ATP pyrophosphohydrolase/phosphoribosyl-AMP cyclohydrolase
MMKKQIIKKIDFNKGNGLVPAIIQDNNSQQVLMLGYMNRESLEKTISEGKVCFFSRSKNRLWVKGETSGNFLFVKEITPDCDNDTLLIKADPVGPVCHTGSQNCFSEESPKGFLYKLQDTISQRIDENAESSYTNKLYKKGMKKVAQKVGEEATELVIEAFDNRDDLFENEAADLLYHFLILLKAKGKRLEDIEKVLEERHRM